MMRFSFGVSNVVEVGPETLWINMLGEAFGHGAFTSPEQLESIQDTTGRQSFPMEVRA